eukprot:CAMPEP_0197835174 /NCGR_PEP_ID=MMETSP1437-20131217/24944_1 /TAXON_ID=49252 ORGANISM="Eucampia antarctica, Strain CCMP1452" /NCGR_SAMPLE_ID=MMETSP1437 /ASSEMBLY_ACC=CAM_ASM_001096 /LENGTH=214 /DNA_ID=CAMNT_0043440393 /DNA_START=169 /DNA_END=813 /DNA_ORIENTATION=+
MAEFNDDFADLYERKQALAIGSLDTDGPECNAMRRGNFFNPQSETNDSCDVAEYSDSPSQLSSDANGTVMDVDRGQKITKMNTDHIVDSSNFPDFSISSLDHNSDMQDLNDFIDVSQVGISTPRKSYLKTRVNLPRSIIIENLQAEADANEEAVNTYYSGHDSSSTFQNKKGSIPTEHMFSRRESVDPLASALGALDAFADFSSPDTTDKEFSE